MYGKLADVGSHFGAICLIDSRSGMFLLPTCVSEPLRGTPWTDLSLSWGILASMILTYWRSLGATLFQMSNIPEQQMAPTTPSTQTVKEKIDRQSIQTNHVLLLLFNNAA